MKRFLLIFGFISVLCHSDAGFVNLADNLGEKECIPLTDCYSYLWLIQNVEDLSLDLKMRRKELFTFIRSQMCGYKNNTPLVFCHEKEEILQEYFDHNSNDSVDSDPIHLECNGSIVFHHLPQIRPSDFEIDNLDLLKASKFSKLLSGNLEKGMLVGRDVVEITNEGSCCWMIFSKSKFRGLQQSIPVGFRGKASFHPASVKKYCGN